LNWLFHTNITMENTLTKKNATLSKVIFGTSALGNLYSELDDSTKCKIVEECFLHSTAPVVFDSAGKYGAGLALESIGKSLKALNVPKDKVIISNKLGWLRTELKTPEPTFEPGVWRNLKFDAIQRISYDGIIQCFEQGNDLLNGYLPKLVSIHDPDEYLALARTEKERLGFYEDILEAYEALMDLKKQYDITVGVGAKNWRIIEEISNGVKLDWVMIANSMTIKSHPAPLLQFMDKLSQDGVAIVNSAVFHGGFLTGGEYFDYQFVSKREKAGQSLIKWREDFNKICKAHNISPAAACVQFALSAPGVQSIALNTSNPERVKANLTLANSYIPAEFWSEMKDAKLIEDYYNYI